MGFEVGVTVSFSRVVVLGAHPLGAHSMRRYSSLIEAAYIGAGASCVMLTPPDWISRHVSLRGARKLARYVENLVLFPVSLTWRIKPGDLVHVADHSDSPWLLLLRRSASTLVTVHDLLAVQAAAGEFSEYRPRLSGRFYQDVIRHSLGRADCLIAVSETTAVAVRRLLPRVRVAVLHLPVAPAVSVEAVPVHTSPYVMIVSSSDWRKQRQRALQVWLRLRRLPENGRLQLISVGPPFSVDELGLADASEHISDIRVFENLDEADLADLYKNAEALLQLSVHEGFGWPALEANLYGVVAICSDIPVFREVSPKNLFISDPQADVGWENVWAGVQDRVRKVAARNYAREHYGFTRFVEGLCRVANAVQEDV